jgi:hypothetical protein
MQLANAFVSQNLMFMVVLALQHKREAHQNTMPRAASKTATVSVGSNPSKYRSADLRQLPARETTISISVSSHLTSSRQPPSQLILPPLRSACLCLGEWAIRGGARLQKGTKQSCQSGLLDASATMPNQRRLALHFGITTAT